MQDRSVSVVIPAYKAAHTISRAIDSVLSQTCAAHEIIVIDDGSPDDLADVVSRRYGSPVTLLRQPNGGAASARNLGIARATGKFIAFLDADDYWEPKKIERQLAIFQENPSVGLVAGRYFTEIPGDCRTASHSPAAHRCDRVLNVNGPDAFRIATIIWTGTVIVRRDVLRNEQFVSGLEPAEDRDLWARLVARCGAYLASDLLSTAVLEPESLSRTNPDRDCGNMMRVVKRNRASLGFWASRQWIAHTYYRWSIGGESLAAAIARLVVSFLIWPLPFTTVEQHNGRRYPRLKRLLYLASAAAIGRRP